MGLAECVVDLVETGDTMRAAGLDVASTIMDSQVLLPSPYRDPYAVHIALSKQSNANVPHGGPLHHCATGGRYGSRTILLMVLGPPL